jgi:WD40 repeat protein
MKPHRLLSMRLLRASLLLASAGMAAGQLSGPITGYFYQSASRSIRPILGVPGSAVVSDPVVTDLQFGSVSPDGRWALVERSDGAAMVRLAARPEEIPLPAVIPEINLAVWSSSGRVLIVGSSSGKLLQPLLLSGNQWSPEAPLDLSGLPGTLSAIGASYDGSQCAIGLMDSAEGGIYFVSNGAPVLVAPAPLPVKIAFSATGARYYAAGSTAGVIDVFEGAKHVGALTLAPDSDTPPEIAALALSADGKHLFATAKDVPSLWAFDLASGEPRILPLEANPGTLLPVGERSWLLLNSPQKSTEPLSIVKDSDPAVSYFVPVAQLRSN